MKSILKCLKCTIFRRYTHDDFASTFLIKQSLYNFKIVEKMECEDEEPSSSEIPGIEFSVLRSGAVRTTKRVADASCQTEPTEFPKIRTKENGKEFS